MPISSRRSGTFYSNPIRQRDADSAAVLVCLFGIFLLQKVLSTMSNKADFDQVHASLKKAGLNHDQQYRVMKQLTDDRLVVADAPAHNDDTVNAAAGKGELTILSPMQAMRRTELHPLLKHVQAQLRRVGFNLDLSDSRPLNIVEIDRAFRAANLDFETRYWIKGELSKASLI
jgi:hypothetical protein